MSFSIIEIKSIPNYQLLNDDVEEAKRSVCSSFIDLLSYVSSITIPEQVVLELILHKIPNKLPRMFITIRCDEHAGSISPDKIIQSISSYMTNLHYVALELSGDTFLGIVDEMRDQLNGKIIALTKEEKLVTSNISYSGYYYYTDVFDSFGRSIPDIYNYASLIDHLLLCEKTMVAFQLIPTKITPDEYYALSNLSSELATTTHGLFVNNQMVKEVTAEAPRKTYNYYVERASQPIFIGNIIVASDRDDLYGVTALIKNGIQQSVPDTISLVSIELENSSELSRDFFHFPWNVFNQLELNYRNINIWNGSVYQPTNLLRLPFLFSISEVTTFFKLPIDDGVIHGLNSVRGANDNELIDKKALSSTNIQFGQLIDSQNSVIGTPDTSFTRHTLIVGTPGSGKTTFALNLLLQFHQKHIPFLAIEPTKTEYRALLDKIPELQVFTPGNSRIAPYIVNPFIPPKGVRLEQYIPSLMSAFKAAFSMETPLDVIFLKAIRQCYALYGWKNGSTCDDSDTQPFGLFEFVLVFKKIVSESSYKDDTKANIETGGTFRLLNLFDQNKYIYDSINTISIDELLTQPTVIELNAIEDDEQKALIIALLLIGVCLYTKNKGSSSGDLKNILMIDEAHVLLDSQHGMSSEQNKAQSTTVRSIQKMIAEIRSFGTGIIIADQAPSKVTDSVIADTDIKVAFRLVDQKERNIISNSINLNEQQSLHMARLKKGEAFVYYSDLETPKLIATPNIRKENEMRIDIPDEEIKAKNKYWITHTNLLVPFYECSRCPQCAMCKQCNTQVREKAEYYSSHIVSTLGNRIKDKDTLEKYMYRLHELVIKYEAKANKRLPIKIICNCTKVHFIRDILLMSDFTMNRTLISDLLNRTTIKER